MRIWICRFAHTHTCDMRLVEVRIFLYFYKTSSTFDTKSFQRWIDFYRSAIQTDFYFIWRLQSPLYFIVAQYITTLFVSTMLIALIEATTSELQGNFMWDGVTRVLFSEIRTPWSYPDAFIIFLSLIPVSCNPFVLLYDQSIKPRFSLEISYLLDILLINSTLLSFSNAALKRKLPQNIWKY